jgi:hypothetical protein
VDAEERLESALAQKVAWVREAAGERFAAIELNLLLSGVLVTDDRQQAAAERARAMQAGGSAVTADMLLESPYWLIGSVDEMVERIERLRATLGISYVVAREDAFEAFAPVVARLAGR